MLKNSIWKQAVQITSSFEGPAGYSNCTGNFDGQYLSYGFLQWNFGRGTLQPLFKRLFNEFPAVATRVLPGGGVALKNALNAGTEKQWALTIQVNNKVVDPWLSALKALGNTPEMQKIQEDAAQWYKDKAYSMAKAFGLMTDRAYCLFFDIAVQNGGVATFAFPDGIGYMDKLRMVVEAVVKKSNIQWQTVVRQRKSAIAEGSGIVYGSMRTFTFYDAPMDYDEAMRVPVNELVYKGIISSPGYWMENADGLIPCNGEYCGNIIKKVTNTTLITEAVSILASKGVLSSPTYWIENTGVGKTVIGKNAKALIYKIADII